MSLRTLPGVDKRVEDGPIQFGSDFPGLFLRGDSAFYLGMTLSNFINRTDVKELLHPLMERTVLQGLANDLLSVDIRKTTLAEKRRRMKNLLEEYKPKFHRDLFVLENNVRRAKTEYTLQDLWIYYNLVWMGNNDTLGATSSIDRGYLARRKKLLIDQVDPLIPAHQALFEQYINKWGLEVVLSAIEDHCSNDSPSLPLVEELAYKLRNAASEIARADRRSRMC